MLAIAIGATPWFHIPLHLDLPFICLATACGMWIIQTLAWAARILYRNVGGRQVREARVSCLGEEGFAPNALTVDIRLKRAWQVRSGQYVYLTVLSNPHHLFGQIQAHAFLIAWSEENPSSTPTAITLLVEFRNGFSSDLRLCEGPIRVLIDGPYGTSDCLQSFDKVLFIASGAGVAAHLLAIRELLRGHHNRTARVRRVTLLWLLEERGMCAGNYSRTTSDFYRARTLDPYYSGCLV